MTSRWLAKRLHSKTNTKAASRFISKASTLGIALGVTVLLVAMSVINGFEKALKEELLTHVAHLSYKTPQGSFRDWQNTQSVLARHPDVIGVSPALSQKAMVGKNEQLKAVSVDGILPSEYAKAFTALEDKLHGKPISGLEKGQAVLGDSALKALGANIGDTVTLYLQKPGQSGFAAPIRVSLEVVSSVSLGESLDSQLLLVHLGTLHDALNLPANYVTDITVQLSDPYLASNLAMTLGYQIEDFVYVSSWLSSQGAIYNDIQLVRFIVYVVVLLIIAVASFNLVSTLVMSVQEKLSAIAILMTMGATSALIIRTFLFSGLRYALVGLVLGTLVGTVLSLTISDLYLGWQTLTGQNLLGQTYFVDYLPSEFNPYLIPVIWCVTLMLALLASVYPALKATKVDPAHVLGH